MPIVCKCFLSDTSLKNYQFLSQRNKSDLEIPIVIIRPSYLRYQVLQL